MDISQIESLQSLLDKIIFVDVDVLKKRHIYYIWFYFYMENMEFITFYQTTSKTMSSDYAFFTEIYVKQNYTLLYKKNDIEKLMNYIDIMNGKKDVIIETFLEQKTFYRKKKKWFCFC